MSATHRDSKRYYRVLGVKPSASEQEIRLAYVLVKGSEDARAEQGLRNDEVARAYEFLRNPVRRRAYDRAETASVFSLGIKLDDPRLLVATLVLLVAILGFVWVPLYGSRFRSFSPGDRLVDTRGVELGVVVQTDETHQFPGGVAAPAYLVELTESGQMRWFPAADLQGTCRRAK